MNSLTETRRIRRREALFEAGIANVRHGEPRRATRRRAKSAVLLAAVAAGLAFGTAAVAGDFSCHLTFSMKGWSAIYKSATGAGTVTCTNGATMKVKLESKGLGLTAGKSSIDSGKGAITGLTNINDVLGTYVSADASAGAVKAAAAAVLTKGEVSLALSGTGRGWDVGVSISDFTIKR
jgi:hypothetical protein